jgi:hypothetical protein
LVLFPDAANENWVPVQFGLVALIESCTAMAMRWVSKRLYHASFSPILYIVFISIGVRWDPQISWLQAQIAGVENRLETLSAEMAALQSHLFSGGYFSK